MEKHWGYHLLINAAGGQRNLVTDRENVARFVDELVKQIDMVKYGPLWIDHFATHDPDKAGLSFCQMISTSNITGHFVDKSGDFYIDIFSCKPFAENVAVSVVMDFFEPLDVKSLMVYRDPNKFKMEL